MFPVVERRQLVSQGFIANRFERRLQVLDMLFRFQQLALEFPVGRNGILGRFDEMRDVELQFLGIFNALDLFTGLLERELP